MVAMHPNRQRFARCGVVVLWCCGVVVLWCGVWCWCGWWWAGIGIGRSSKQLVVSECAKDDVLELVVRDVMVLGEATAHGLS